MHIAIQISLEEVEDALGKHWASVHGFELVTFIWSNDADGNLELSCAAKPLDKHAPPVQPQIIDADAVQLIIQKLLTEQLAAQAPVPTAAPPMPVRAPAAPTEPPAIKHKKGRHAHVTSNLNIPVSWIENPEAAPAHVSENKKMAAKRLANMQRLRREAGGVDGLGDVSPQFDPLNPPPSEFKH